MNKDTLDTFVSALTAVAVMLGLIGLVARYVLLPWLREHLLAPMRQVEKQVTENSHHNERPTVLDRIDDVQTEVRVLADELRRNSDECAAVRQELADHSDWSARWVDLMEREVALLRREQAEEEKS